MRLTRLLWRVKFSDCFHFTRFNFFRKMFWLFKQSAKAADPTSSSPSAYPSLSRPCEVLRSSNWITWFFYARNDLKDEVQKKIRKKRRRLLLLERKKTFRPHRISSISYFGCFSSSFLLIPASSEEEKFLRRRLPIPHMWIVYEMYTKWNESMKSEHFVTLKISFQWFIKAHIVLTLSGGEILLIFHVSSPRRLELFLRIFNDAILYHFSVILLLCSTQFAILDDVCKHVKRQDFRIRVEEEEEVWTQYGNFEKSFEVLQLCHFSSKAKGNQVRLNRSGKLKMQRQRLIVILKRMDDNVCRKSQNESDLISTECRKWKLKSRISENGRGEMLSNNNKLHETMKNLMQNFFHAILSSAVLARRRCCCCCCSSLSMSSFVVLAKFVTHVCRGWKRKKKCKTWKENEKLDWRQKIYCWNITNCWHHSFLQLDFSPFFSRYFCRFSRRLLNFCKNQAKVGVWRFHWNHFS